MSPEMDDVPLPDLILVPTKKLRPGTLQGAYLKQVTRLNDFSQVFSAPQLAHQILSCPLASCRPEVVGWPDGRGQVGMEKLVGEGVSARPQQKSANWNHHLKQGRKSFNMENHHWDLYIVTVIIELNLKKAMASMANCSATGGQGPRTTWLMQLR